AATTATNVTMSARLTLLPVMVLINANLECVIRRAMVRTALIRPAIQTIVHGRRSDGGPVVRCLAPGAQTAKLCSRGSHGSHGRRTRPEMRSCAGERRAGDGVCRSDRVRGGP